MRLATQIWNAYKNNGVIQDAAETLVGAGIGAGGQLLFTDMSPEEIALSTGLGIGAAMAARPLAGRAGYAVGRQLDKQFPDAHKNEYVAQFAIGSPENMKIIEQAVKDGHMPKELLEIAQAKANQNYALPNGGSRGTLEGLLGTLGRQYGDNVAQLGVAAAMPILMQKEDAS